MTSASPGHVVRGKFRRDERSRPVRGRLRDRGRREPRRGLRWLDIVERSRDVQGGIAGALPATSMKAAASSGSAQDATGGPKPGIPVGARSGMIQDLGPSRWDLFRKRRPSTSSVRSGHGHDGATGQHGYLVDAGVMYDLNDLRAGRARKSRRGRRSGVRTHPRPARAAAGSMLLVPGPGPRSRVPGHRYRWRRRVP